MYGKNELENDEKVRVTDGGKKEGHGQQDPIWMKFLEQFKDPLIGMLGVSCVISMIVGQYDDAISILLAVTIVATVAFIQVIWISGV